MTPLAFLTKVKDHVTDTNVQLTDVERVRLRSVSIQYRPPGTNRLLELEDAIDGSFHWGFTPIGELTNGRLGNTGFGHWEIGPITIWGYSHMDWPCCVLAFTLIHEMGHVVAPAVDENDTTDGHGPAFVAACKRLGIEEHVYKQVKSVKCFKEMGWQLNHICDPQLLQFIEELGPISDWYSRGLYPSLAGAYQV